MSRESSASSHKDRDSRSEDKESREKRDESSRDRTRERDDHRRERSDRDRDRHHRDRDRPRDADRDKERDRDRHKDHDHSNRERDRRDRFDSPLPSPSPSPPPAQSLTDGGKSWRDRALKRARERAAEEGRPLEDVIKERFGSMEALTGSTPSPAPDRATSEESKAGDKDRQTPTPSSRDKERAERIRRSMRAPTAESGAAELGGSLSWRAASPAESDSSTASNWRDRLKRAKTSASATPSPNPDGSQTSNSSPVSQPAPPAVPSAQPPTPAPAFSVSMAPVPASLSAPAASAAASATAAPVVAPVAVTEADINKLMARALKAKLMKDLATHQKLTDEADRLRALLAAAPPPEATGPAPVDEDPEPSHGGKHVEVLSELDEFGRPMKLRRPGDGANAGPKPSFVRKRPPAEKMNEDGTRKAFFHADAEESKDLRSLVEEERLKRTQDYDVNFAKSIAKKSKFKAVGLDEQFDMADITMEQYEGAASKLPKHKREDFERQKQISSHNKQSSELGKCSYCFSNPTRPKQLTCAIGVKFYLALPERKRVAPNHCQIIPMEHITAVTAMDEDEYEELQYFKKHIVKMFAAQRQGCVFIETVYSMKQRRHTVIDCIPLSEEEFEEAPMYFKKAILESDAEWAVNKKLVDTREKGLLRSIPKDFPYFHVEFGMLQGFAHVIEDEERFSPDFGKEVLCGMTGEPAQFVLRAKPEPLDVQRAKVREFSELWKPYDWTAKLDGSKGTSSSSSAAAGAAQ